MNVFSFKIRSYFAKKHLDFEKTGTANTENHLYSGSLIKQLSKIINQSFKYEIQRSSKQLAYRDMR